MQTYTIQINEFQRNIIASVLANRSATQLNDEESEELMLLAKMFGNLPENERHVPNALHGLHSFRV